MTERAADPRDTLGRLAALRPAEQYHQRGEIFRAWLPACRRIADDGDAASLTALLPTADAGNAPFASVLERDPRWGHRARAVVGLAVLTRRLRDGGVGEATAADLLAASTAAWEAANADGGERPSEPLGATELEREPLVVRQVEELFAALVVSDQVDRSGDRCGIAEMLRYLARLPEPWARATNARFVVDAAPAAVVVVTLERRHGTGRVLRHVAANPFLRVNRSFVDGVAAGAAAVDVAWPATPRDVDVRWRLDGERWGDGAEITGGSCALAVAVARRACLDPLARFEVRPDVALTGCAQGGRVGSVSRFAAKAEAAAALGLTLVVPAENLSDAQAVAPAGKPVLAAETVVDAADIALCEVTRSTQQPRPAPEDTFGRDRERRALARLIGAGHRLIALVGPPGIGKTHLARVAAADHPDEHRIVELESVGDPAAVALAVAKALSIKPGRGDDAAVLVARHLAERRLLLVLDNFEHLLAAAPLLENWLAAAPRLTVLVTSQRRLDTPSEHPFPVGPLDVPGEDAVDADIVMASPAAAMFVHAARREGHDLDVGRLSAAIAALCRAVDGVPLAIRLAAGLVSTLSPEQLAAALRKGAVDLSRPTGAAGTHRHRSTDAAVQWACKFLDDDRRDLLERLSMFEAAFSIEAAAAVCGCPPTDGRLISTMAGLVAASLVESFVDPTLNDSAPRFRLLSVIRWSACRQASPATLRECRDRHVEHYLSVVRTLGARLTGDDQAAALDRMAAEEADIDKALDRVVAIGDAERAATFARFLYRYWLARGLLGQCRARMSEILALGGKASEDLAVATVGAAVLAQDEGDNGAARSHLEQAEALARSVASDLALALALVNRGHLADDERRPEDAQRHYHEAAAAAAAVPGKPGRRLVGHAQLGLGVVAARRNHHGEAATHFEQAESIFDQVGDRRSRAQAMLDLAQLAALSGSATSAQRWLEEALTISRTLRDEGLASIALTYVAAVDVDLGARPRAIERLLEALAVAVRLGLRRVEADALEGLMAALDDQPVWVARLYGRAQAVRRTTGISSDRNEHWQPAVAAAGQALNTGFATDAAGGAEMTTVAIHAALSAEFPKTT